jgi:hypothetical protein
MPQFGTLVGKLSVELGLVELCNNLGFLHVAVLGNQIYNGWHDNGQENTELILIHD